MFIVHVKIWLNIGILGQNRIGLVFDFCVCHFIGIGLVSVCHFPENDISNTLTPSLPVDFNGRIDPKVIHRSSRANGATCPPPPTSDRTPREIDEDPRRFSCPKKWEVGLQDLLRSFTCTDATADVLRSCDYEKGGVVEVVEGVTLVGPR